MSETFDPNELDYSGIEPSEDLEFRPFKGETLELEIDDITWQVDEQGRKKLRTRYKLVDGQTVELVKQDGDELLSPEVFRAASVYDQFWFHTPKAIPMFLRWLENMGLSAAEYKSSADKKAYVESLKGMRFKGIVIYDEEFKNNYGS